MRFFFDYCLKERATWVSWRDVRVHNWHRPLSTYMSQLLGQGPQLRHFAAPRRWEAIQLRSSAIGACLGSGSWSGRSRRLTTPPKTLPRRPHRPHPEIRQSGSVWGCSGLTGVDAAIAPWKSCLEVLAVTRRAALFRRSLPRGSGRGAYTWDIKRNLHRLQAFFDECPPLSGL